MNQCCNPQISIAFKNGLRRLSSEKAIIRDRHRLGLSRRLPAKLDLFASGPHGAKLSNFCDLQDFITSQIIEKWQNSQIARKSKF